MAFFFVFDKTLGNEKNRKQKTQPYHGEKLFFLNRGSWSNKQNLSNGFPLILHFHIHVRLSRCVFLSFPFLSFLRLILLSFRQHRYFVCLRDTMMNHFSFLLPIERIIFSLCVL